MKNLVVRIIALMAAAALFVAALLVSVVFFAVAFAAILVIGGIFLWKTRHLRRQMRQRRGEGRIIEGTVLSSEDKRP